MLKIVQIYDYEISTNLYGKHPRIWLFIGLDIWIYLDLHGFLKIFKFLSTFFKDCLLNEIEGMKDEFLNTKQYLKVKNQLCTLFLY